MQSSVLAGLGSPIAAIGTTASTIVTICAAVTGVTVLVRGVASRSRRDIARKLKICWQVGPDVEQTGALAYNESKESFEEVVLTVTCGLRGREVRRDIGLLRSGQDYLWAGPLVHDAIAAKRSDRPVVVEAGETHITKPHGVQATFRNGKAFWFRDEEQTGRVDELVIWAEKTRAVTLKRYFGRRSAFKRAYPVSVTVRAFERTEALEQAFTTLAATGDPSPEHGIPDIVVGPHDWIGRVAREESVVEPPISRSWTRRIAPAALDALSRNDRLYAIPYVFDSVALIRNDTLAGTGPMPRTLVEAVEAGTEVMRGKDITGGMPVALQVGAPDANGNAGDPYHMWPLFSSLGGSFFGYQDSGRFDDISDWRDRFVEAFTRLAEFGGDGVLPPALGRTEALELFLGGRAPFFICSSRGLAAIRARGMKVTVAAVPAAGHHAARSMVSAYGFYIYEGGLNIPAARDLVSSYVAQPKAGLDLNRIQPLVPVQQDAMSRVAERDAALAPYVDQCRTGLVMPSWPEMREAWKLIGRTEYRVLAGDGDPRQLAEEAATQGWELLREARGAD
ncbi:sugar ABC transporter substrate-binding protein [Amycolatopsis pigmentata]|uniref:Extracellular solute-binding protein n=1 Tax=Amycolatopsis pigmentata TaxID=450801 RepID=A0ABW5FWH0_9PSEU